MIGGPLLRVLLNTTLPFIPSLCLNVVQSQTRQVKDGFMVISENKPCIVCVKRLIILCWSHFHGLSQNVTLILREMPSSKEPAHQLPLEHAFC